MTALVLEARGLCAILRTCDPACNLTRQANRKRLFLENAFDKYARVRIGHTISKNILFEAFIYWQFKSFLQMSPSNQVLELCTALFCPVVLSGSWLSHLRASTVVTKNKNKFWYLPSLVGLELVREDPKKLLSPTFGHWPLGEGWSKRLPGWFGALIYHHNGDFYDFFSNQSE